MKILAIDYGNKRTGLAVCDPSQTICSPLAVLDSGKKLIAKIIETINEQNAEAVVVGLPLNMDDTEGPQAETVRRFADNLKAAVDIPLYFQDERLTSFAADEKLKPAGLGPAESRRRQDAVAAAQILQAFLENSGK